MKYLRLYHAIIRIKLNKTIVFYKKKLYFCDIIVRIKMIQRIQTLYLAICFIASGVLPFFVSIWTEKNGEETQAIYFTESTTAMVLFGLSALLAVISIFSFKKRQNQFVLNRLNIISNFILLGFFVYRTLNLSGGTLVSEKGIGITLPAISIVLLVLANRAIKKDEDLVKSVDRLR